MPAPFSKVLVANRGEIAIRVFRALRELGIGSVAVYSEADRGSLHVRRADEARLIGPGAPAESYLDGERIIAAGRASGAEAIHPGYGFLAENAAFAQACEDAGLVWIGPPPSAIEAMGSKIGARQRMRAAGVPIVPGTTEEIRDAATVIALGEEYGWPIAIKASAGGGGRGMEVVASADDAERALETARRQGEAYFADAAVYVEKYVEDPRHVEIQVLADRHGATIHLGERDCTLQRRHQKVLEESPSPAVSAALRARMGEMAVGAARAVGYVGAGTVECLLDRNGAFFFLEMNTRIQVEHPVTELVTGFDLVRAQIEIAAGASLPIAQEDVELRGHAFECRINAEDAGAGFRPAPGRVVRYHEPSGPGVRVDSGIEQGDEVVALYDPLIAKLCVWDSDRERARLRMLRALDELVVEGVPTLAPLHRLILQHPSFIAGETCAGLIEGELADALAPAGPAEPGPPPAVQRHYAVEVDGARYDVSVALPADELLAAERRRRAERRARGSGAGAGGERVMSPMQGTVLRVEVGDGDAVAAGQVLAIVEAMKMENEIRAHVAGVVRELAIAAGDSVRSGQALLRVAES
ncbi:MAG: acetyl-CoA/propionyl-CoA carboxylase, biotin carboxylase, biotin carboxyl carrier protein [Gaiellales bacterium]|jgi:acetyl-CoA/propionyl-CoA carboxylase biotin carboxyl carrier protein|nr:acetyl-CoA/propionyl-CoA carboxylase, biotin carboxylase, biotin carboxyl carrier protein [Gaiellales bacterium]